MRRAFTIVELIVVIGVMALVTGLVVSAATSLSRRQEVQSAETAVRLLDMAISEWETHTDRKLTFGARETSDIWSEREFTLVLPEVLRVIRKSRDVESILAQIDTNLVYEFETGLVPGWFAANPYTEPQLEEFAGDVTVLDPWGSPIYATHPGGRATAGVPTDDDGTEITFNETLYGHAKHRRVCIISAGPDRRFGLPTEFPQLDGAARNDAIREARLDNVFSYEPYFPPLPGGSGTPSGPAE